ncbi:MAG: hypothetical protein Q8O40_17755 [Chloroflexota bacterium]|nr:hypothetical protein [Chloroflexota bacterium]
MSESQGSPRFLCLERGGFVEEVAATDGAPIYQLTRKGELLLVRLLGWLDLEDASQPALGHQPSGDG